MTIQLNPTALREAWKNATHADDEIGEARLQVPAARGTDLEDMAGCVTDAADDMDGVLAVVEAIIAEFGTGVENCITTWQNTDHNATGGFNALR